MVEIFFVTFNITWISTFADRTQSVRLVDVKVTIVSASSLLRVVTIVIHLQLYELFLHILIQIAMTHP